MNKISRSSLLEMDVIPHGYEDTSRVFFDHRNDWRGIDLLSKVICFYDNCDTKFPTLIEFIALVNVEKAIFIQSYFRKKIWLEVVFVSYREKKHLIIRLHAYIEMG